MESCQVRCKEVSLTPSFTFIFVLYYFCAFKNNYFFSLSVFSTGLTATLYINSRSGKCVVYYGEFQSIFSQTNDQHIYIIVNRGKIYGVYSPFTLHAVFCACSTTYFLLYTYTQPEYGYYYYYRYNSPFFCFCEGKEKCEKIST